MSRWLVGSSSRRRSGSLARALAVKAPRAGRLQPVLDSLEFLHETGVACVGQLHREIVVLPQQVQMALSTGGNDLIDRSGQIFGDVLREEGDPGLGALDDLAGIRANLPIEHLQKGGLAGAVSPQKADPLARLDGERRPVQEKRSSETHGNVVDPDQCHQKLCL